MCCSLNAQQDQVSINGNGNGRSRKRIQENDLILFSIPGTTFAIYFEEKKHIFHRSPIQVEKEEKNDGEKVQSVNVSLSACIQYALFN